jgi:hypothetical protein
MSIRQLPILPGIPFQSFQVDLDGVRYGFEFRWNHRAGAWAMSMLDVNGDALLTGIRLCFGGPVLPLSRSLSTPPGELLLVESTAGVGDPTLETLGSQVLLLYMDAAEILSVTAA